MLKTVFHKAAAALAVVFALSLVSQAQTSPSTFPNVNIKNFGQMDERYYRGAQPKEEDYAALKALGVNTVIDLQEKTKSYEKSAVEALGMKYINIPIGSGEPPTQAQIDAFFKVVNAPNTGTFFVHCKGGIHRTGVTAAVYRFTKYGWDYDKAYKEMLNYDFYSTGRYADMKDFVVDYAAKMKAGGAAVQTAH